MRIKITIIDRNKLHHNKEMSKIEAAFAASNLNFREAITYSSKTKNTHTVYVNTTIDSYT